MGRSSELRRLHDLLGQALDGCGRLVLVSGEPGIGKTRLVEELASSLDVPVWWGRCWEGPGAPSYWPWAQVLRSCLAECTDAESLSGVSELSGLLSGHIASLHTMADTDQSRFLLFDTVVRLLRYATASTGAMLVLDDLQWADGSSLQLFRFLSRELRACRLLVVGTYRDVETDARHPLSMLLGELNDTHLALNGLAAGEVSELVASVGHPPTEDFVRAVCVETNGNPLYVHELVRLLDAGDRATRVPGSVQAVIDRRVGRLAGDSVRVLRAAAVLGAEFDIEMVCAVLGEPHDLVVHGLAEAAAARLVEPRPGLARFVHALTREALLAGLAPGERSDLHERAAWAIEIRSAKNLGPRLAEIAHHLVAAGVDHHRTIDYLTRAARRAMDLLAYEEAAEHATQAITVLAAAPDPVRHCDLLLLLGQACRATGDVPAARSALSQAAAVAQEVRLPDRLAHAALGMSDEYTVGYVDDLETRTLEAALAVLPEDEKGLRARVSARLAKALMFTPDARRRESLAESAITLARDHGDPAVLAGVLFDRHVATWDSSSARERLAIATEIVTLGETSPDPALALHGRALRMSSLLELGDMVGFDAEIEQYDRHTRQLRLTRYQWLIPLMRATQAIIEGRLNDVDALTEEALRLGRLAGQESAELYLLTVRLCARAWERGRLGELADMTRTMAAAFPALPGLRTAVVLTQLDARHVDAARAEFERLASYGFHRLPRDPTWLVNTCALAIAAHCLDDPPRAGELYDLLADHEHLVSLVNFVGAGCGAPVAYYLGMLAITTRRYDAAVAHLEIAVKLSTRLGAPVFTANAYAKLAVALTAHEGPGERAIAARQAADRGIQALELELVHHPVARTSVPARTAVLRREGEYWSVEFGSTAARVKDSVGLRHLARLLAEPGRELHVLDLAAFAGPSGDTGPVLDTRAKADYRQRLTDLAEDLAEAESFADPARTEHIQAEIDALTEQLASAVGLGGRDRHTGMVTERARSAVTKATKAAITRIEAAHPDLGGHLRAAVRTGTYCAYVPDPTTTIIWQVTT